MTGITNLVSRRGFVAMAGILAIVFVAPFLLADAPATAPAEAGTPQGFLQNVTNDRVAAMSDDEVLGIIDFNADSEKDKADAQLLAANNLAESKLEVAVRKKWGKSAEVAVAHAMLDNVRDDEADAQWTITGDHARADFGAKKLSPVLLVKSGGEWKLDLQGYREAVGDQFVPILRQATDVTQKLNQELDGNAYANADDFVKHVNEEMGKIGG